MNCRAERTINAAPRPSRTWAKTATRPPCRALTELVRQSDPGTRYLAAKALGQIGDEAESAVPVLLQALRDNDMFLRAGITGALIQIGYPAVPGLTRALFDPSSAVKRAACKGPGQDRQRARRASADLLAE